MTCVVDILYKWTTFKPIYQILQSATVTKIRWNKYQYNTYQKHVLENNSLCEITKSFCSTGAIIFENNVSSISIQQQHHKSNVKDK